MSYHKSLIKYVEDTMHDDARKYYLFFYKIQDTNNIVLFQTAYAKNSI